MRLQCRPSLPVGRAFRMTVEFELKLSTDPDTLEALASTRLPEGWQADAWQSARLENHYFDTEDAELQARGIALRIRGENGRYTQTLKAGGQTVGGVHQRLEFNHGIEKAELDPAGFPDQDWASWLAAQVRAENLTPIFRTDFTRRSRRLRHESGTVVELALDLGSVLTDDEQEVLCELEIELLQGDAQPLFALARELIQHHPLVPDNRSKAERGYRLLEWHEPPSHRLQPLELNEDVSLWSILNEAIHIAWSHWQRYEKEFVSLPSVQSVEQMRRAVGLMRHILVCYHGLPLPAAMHSWARQLTHMLKTLQWVRYARAQNAADRIILSVQGENYLPFQEEFEDILPDERLYADGMESTHHLINSRAYALFAVAMAEFQMHPPEPAPALQELAAERATTLVVRQWEDLQTIWREAPIMAEFGYYTQQRRLLRRALWSSLLFGDLFQHRQRDLFIDPCRDLLAGVEDIATLNCLEQMAKQLPDSSQEDIAHWLMAQRETLWTALQMTRDRALRAEPDDLETD